MDKECNSPSPEKGTANDQRSYEEMINIVSNQGNGKSIHSNISFCP